MSQKGGGSVVFLLGRSIVPLSLFMFRAGSTWLACSSLLRGWAWGCATSVPFFPKVRLLRVIIRQLTGSLVDEDIDGKVAMDDVEDATTVF